MEQILLTLDRKLTRLSPLPIAATVLLVSLLGAAIGAAIGAQGPAPVPTSITITEKTSPMNDGFAAVGVLNGQQVLVRGADLVPGQVVPAYLVPDDLPGDHIYSTVAPYTGWQTGAANGFIVGTVTIMIIGSLFIFAVMRGNRMYQNRRRRSNRVLDAALSRGTRPSMFDSY